MKSKNGQCIIEFDSFAPLAETLRWPDNQHYPLNLPSQNRTVESEIEKDILNSTNVLIVTGFTSLSHLIDAFGSNRYDHLKGVQIVLGFEPNIRGRQHYKTDQTLAPQIREYWLKQGLSIRLGGAVIKLIELIKSGLLEFRFSDKLHAKIYVGDRHLTMGSANFSKNGLTKQKEANIRVADEDLDATEQSQYKAIKQIAQNFFDEGKLYNKEMIDMLQSLIKEVTWEEAIARAISEVIEEDRLKQYHELYEKLNKARLWPTQWKGIAQAMSIIQDQSNVLIADPTGSGKTKFGAALILTVINWLWENGKRNRTNSLVVCPPIVKDNWQREFRELGRIDNSQISMGVLSNKKSKRNAIAMEDIEMSNILFVDEAHNYLNPDSIRSKSLLTGKTDHTILATATPINKKADDLLRLIQLLDVDNLSDDDFAIFKDLKSRPRPNLKEAELDKLRKFISQFTVRRTKAQLNKEIEKEPEKYLNREGNQCKFPAQNCEHYPTNETEEDRRLVEKITLLAGQLKGLIYLRSFKKPEYDLPDAEAEIQYIQQRVNSAVALSRYMIRSALRSSHVALIEHLLGSQEAVKLYGFTTKKNSSGNVVGKISEFVGSLPRKSSFKKEQFPKWLVDSQDYNQACQDEILVYTRIGELARRLSGKREFGKMELLLRLQKQHKLLIAFDSTVITLDYLKHLFTKVRHESKVYVVTGSDGNAQAKNSVIKEFQLGSTVTNRIALCSDSMSEGVNLQQASAVVLLDMPSVLRIVEQRIGRIERMDSPHQEIDAYWPDDSEEYSLNGDQRLIDTSILAESIYGSNIRLPQVLRDRHFRRSSDGVQGLIREFKDYVENDNKWEGIHDCFQPVINLKEGKESLIPEQTYNHVRGVKETIKTGVSFIESESDWGFFALRGSETQSPRWYFIDFDGTFYTEYPQICKKLRERLGGKPTEAKWSQESLDRLIDVMREKEWDMLPNKRKRALRVGQSIVKMKLNKERDFRVKTALRNLDKLFNPIVGEAIVDYYGFAELWIDVLQPYLDEKRAVSKRNKLVYNLNSLLTRSEWKKIELDEDRINQLIKKCPYTENLDSKIAACIIGVGTN